MVHFVCEDCDAFFETAAEYQAHRESEHVRPPRQLYGHH